MMKRLLGISALITIGALVWGMSPLLSLDTNPGRDPGDPNLFQFVRIRYNGFLGFGSFRGLENGPPWRHDYPWAEKNFLKILLELTTVETTPDSYLILDMDDPQILDYPFLYVSEPGYWNVTADEIANLQEYVKRGGFLVFDDFQGQVEWNVLESAMKQVDPSKAWSRLSLADPIFHCFFDIETLHMVPPYEVAGPPTWYGWSDESGNLQAIANLNNDIGDYWEWSDESINPLNSNEAYKFGINYVIYALTH